MHTLSAVSDQTFFIYGGLGVDGNTLSKLDSEVCVRNKMQTLFFLCFLIQLVFLYKAENTV